MKTVVINKKKFTDSLNIGGSYAGVSKTMPILDCVKIKVKGNGINIISSDTENAISKRCDIVSADFEGDFCVGYKSLMQYVKLISGDNIELILNDDMSVLNITHKKGSLQLPLYNSEEFPMIKMGEILTEVVIDSVLIHNWLIDAQNFVGDDMLRPQMGCVYLYRRDGELGCVGTDGHKMFYDHIHNDGDSFEYLISRKAVKSICNAAKSNDYLTFKISNSNVTVLGDGVTVISRHLEAKYPNHKSVIPRENNIEVFINKKEIIESVNRCMIGASQASSLVKIEIDGMIMNLSAEDIDFSMKAKEEIAVSSTGKITIGFKATYLLDVLNSLNTDDILIEMNDGTRPALFHECIEGKISSEKICLLMPMMIN